MMEGGMEDGAKAMGDEKMDKEDEAKNDDDDGDPRLFIRIISWIVLVVGLVIGIWGLVYVIMEMTSGDAKEDSAD